MDSPLLSVDAVEEESLSLVAVVAVVSVVVVLPSVVVVGFVSLESRTMFGASSSRKDATQHSGEFQLMVHSFTDQASTLSR